MTNQSINRSIDWINTTGIWQASIWIDLRPSDCKKTQWKTDQQLSVDHTVQKTHRNWHARVFCFHTKKSTPPLQQSVKIGSFLPRLLFFSLSFAVETFSCGGPLAFYGSIRFVKSIILTGRPARGEQVDKPTPAHKDMMGAASLCFRIYGPISPPTRTASCLVRCRSVDRTALCRRRKASVPLNKAAIVVVAAARPPSTAHSRANYASSFPLSSLQTSQ